MFQGGNWVGNVKEEMLNGGACRWWAEGQTIVYRLANPTLYLIQVCFFVVRSVGDVVEMVLNDPVRGVPSSVGYDLSPDLGL